MQCMPGNCNDYAMTCLMDHKPQSCRVTTFHITLAPAQTEDQFDESLYYNQILLFVTQAYIRHQKNHYTADGTLYDDPPILYDDPPINAPCANPWATRLYVYMPPCNSFTPITAGILVGVPPGTAGYGHKRVTDDMAETFHEELRPHLQPSSNLAQESTYTSLGFRMAKWTPRKVNKPPIAAYYLSTNSEKTSYQILSTLHPHFGKPPTISIWGKRVSIAPFPQTAADQLKLYNALQQSAAAYNNREVLTTTVTTTRLQPIRTKAQERLLFKAKAIHGYIIPVYNIANDSPTKYKLFLTNNLRNTTLTNDTIHLLPNLSPLLLMNSAHPTPPNG